jgi:hypothetical protein
MLPENALPFLAAFNQWLAIEISLPIAATFKLSNSISHYIFIISLFSNF